MRRVLIDTNIFIGLEPQSNELSENSSKFAHFARIAQMIGLQLWLHPAQRADLEDSVQIDRGLENLKRAQKYNFLPWFDLEKPTEKSNDWADNLLIEAVKRHAVDFLITEDRKLRNRANRVAGRTVALGIDEAIACFEQELEVSVNPHPNVSSCLAYQLPESDPIFDSIAASYKNFGAWLKKCRSEHRHCYCIKSSKSTDLEAIVILRAPTVVNGERNMKICTFKVSDAAKGNKYGELLLRSIFIHAYKNKINSLHLTCFPAQTQLIELLNSFGFRAESEQNANGELILTKCLKYDWPKGHSGNSLKFFIENGPFVADHQFIETYIVPIKPEFHDRLFPDLAPQLRFAEFDSACGNTMLKAYLSRSAIKLPSSGSLLYFYRSDDLQGIYTWGVVESAIRTRDPFEIQRFVRPRSVFAFHEIEQMCSSGEVATILFRQILTPISSPIHISSLIQSGIIASAPQSLHRLRGKSQRKLLKQCTT